MADNRVYLCFHQDSKKCRVANSPLGQFEETTQSYEIHSRTRIAASESKLLFNFTSIYFVLAEILAVGDLNYEHKKAEIFNGENNSWSRIDDYPFDLGST